MDPILILTICEIRRSSQLIAINKNIKIECTYKPSNEAVFNCSCWENSHIYYCNGCSCSGRK